MNLKTLIAKISFGLACMWIVSLLLPVLSWAASTMWLTYQPATGRLSGLVYVNDPNKVKVTVFDSAYSPTAEDGTVISETYDDNNVRIQEKKYDIAWGPKAPGKIDLTVCGNPVEVKTWTSPVNGTVSYYTYDGFRTGSYRSTGREYFSEHPAGSYLPSGARLFSFTPERDATTYMGLELPGDWSYNGTNHTSVDANKFALSDLALTDETANQSVALKDLQPLLFASIGMLEFHTDPLVKGHTYTLSLSSTSGGDEILLPRAGSYRANIDLGPAVWNWYGTTEVNFDQIPIGNGTPGGTADSRDNGSPYGDMSGCTSSGGGTGDTGGSGGGSGDTGGTGGSGGTGSTGGASNPSGGNGDVQDGDHGVIVGKGAATVIHTTDENGKKVTQVILDPDQLGRALGLLKNKDRGAQTVSIGVDGTGDSPRVELPMASLADAIRDVPDAVITVKSDTAGYDLPVKLLDVNRLAGQLAVPDAKGITITVQMESVTGTAADEMKHKGENKGIKLLAAPVDFRVTAEAGGKTVDIRDFGNTYVSRTVIVPAVLDPASATAALYNPDTGEYTFVPAQFNVKDGKTEVVMKRNGNSIYTVVQAKKSFEDLAGHWARADVELLAGKLLLDGTTDHNFTPEREVTRAEFASMLVRALGLPATANPASTFKDVDQSAWYAGSVGTAAKAGLINGFEDGTFRPNERISREQMAVMAVRAQQFAGKADAPSGKQAAGSLPFADNSAISAWALPAVAQTWEAGIMNGIADNKFEPAQNANRAQAAVILKRLLQSIRFIDG
ncbi:S-layer homology domain-containing protein [Gordoniibacillus kamchatkensis]|uniref:S-layer homology domain-containing protein n=1 Tax=Gordoniibacillus kamchatkensis TaxID=1590651 RepID=UPI000696CD9A|nr:S-layer homology domain-containing protein [Paenibacillus sp. VKM B-2647]